MIDSNVINQGTILIQRGKNEGRIAPNTGNIMNLIFH